MRKRRGEQLNSGSALRRLAERLSQRGRVLLLAALCAAALLAAGKLNFAVAVNMDGDLLGYVSSRQELDSIVSEVQQSVSDALGRDWSAPELTTYMAIGTADEDSVVAERLLSSVEELRELQVVYVNGSAVCAYEDRASALAALDALAARYTDERTDSVRFSEDVAIAAGVVDVRLLEEADKALAAACTVETTAKVAITTTLNYKTEEVTDNRLYPDEGYVETAGINGSDRVEYRTVSRNGMMVSCEETAHNRLEPVTEIVVVGTRVHRSRGNYIWPCEDCWITSYFGPRNIGIGSPDHQGVDIAGDYGTPIHASDGGVVLFADEYSGFGLLVKIQHENGDVTYYAHCSELLVEEGDAVRQGQEIALMGMTGVATGNHCHFEIHPGGGGAADPMDYLPEGVLPYLDE